MLDCPISVFSDWGFLCVGQGPYGVEIALPTTYVLHMKKGICSILTIPGGFSQKPAAQPTQSPLRDFLEIIATSGKLQ